MILYIISESFSANLWLPNLNYELFRPFFLNGYAANPCKALLFLLPVLWAPCCSPSGLCHILYKWLWYKSSSECHPYIFFVYLVPLLFIYYSFLGPTLSDQILFLQKILKLPCRSWPSPGFTGSHHTSPHSSSEPAVLGNIGLQATASAVPEAPPVGSPEVRAP